MQKESLFSKKVQTLLKGLGPDVWFTKVQQVAKKGDPDLLLCVCGEFIAWELKVDKNKASSLQLYKLDGIKIAGGTARIVTPESLQIHMEELVCLIQEKSGRNYPQWRNPSLDLPPMSSLGLKKKLQMN